MKRQIDHLTIHRNQMAKSDSYELISLGTKSQIAWDGDISPLLHAEYLSEARRKALRVQAKLPRDWMFHDRVTELVLKDYRMDQYHKCLVFVREATRTVLRACGLR